MGAGAIANADGREPARFQGEAGRVDAAARQRQPARALSEMPVPVLRANVLQVAEEPEDEDLAIAARARPLPARAVRDVLSRVAGARPRPHHLARNGGGARVVRGNRRAGAAIAVAAAEAGARTGAAVWVGGRLGHRRSRVRDGGRTRRRDPRAADGIRARRRVHVPGEDGERTRGPAAGQDRSRRPARRRHVPADRLQDEVRARSPHRACSCRSTARACAPRCPQQHGRDVAASEAMYLSFEGPQAVVPLEEARQAVRRAYDGGRPPAGGGAERHRARSLSAAGPKRRISARCAASRRCRGCRTAGWPDDE